MCLGYIMAHTPIAPETGREKRRARRASIKRVMLVCSSMEAGCGSPSTSSFAMIFPSPSRIFRGCVTGTRGAVMSTWSNRTVGGRSMTWLCFSAVLTISTYVLENPVASLHSDASRVDLLPLENSVFASGNVTVILDSSANIFCGSKIDRLDGRSGSCTECGIESAASPGLVLSHKPGSRLSS